MAARRHLFFVSFALLGLLTVTAFINCGPGEGSSSGGGSSQRVDPVAFFNTQVRPTFLSRCASCHDIPVRGGTAPLTIFDYATARVLLANGPAANNNAMMNKAQGLNHGGGNTCGSPTQPPCSQITAWWNAEFGGTFTGRYAGQVYYVTSRGVVDGWAVDAQNTGTALTVYFYDGAKPGGTLIGNAPANLAGPAGNFPGNHVFSYTLPANYRNGTARSLYVYIQETEDVLLQGTPLTYTAYTPRAQAFFTSNVLPQLNTQCGSCHQRDFNDAYNYLSSPLPNAGGTATNNVLITKGAGQSHSGGNRCGGINAGACAQIQEWWRREFQ